MFQTNNTLILWWLYTHTFFTYVSCCVSYLTLLMANIKNRKKLQLIQTIWDVMALLTILEFPLETTCSCKKDTIERYWGQQFWQTERHISVLPTEMARPVTVVTFKDGPEYSGRPKPKWSVPFVEPTKIFGILGWMETAPDLCRILGICIYCSVFSISLIVTVFWQLPDDWFARSYETLSSNKCSRPLQ